MVGHYDDNLCTIGICSDVLLVSMGQQLQIYTHMYAWLEAFNVDGSNGNICIWWHQARGTCLGAVNEFVFCNR